MQPAADQFEINCAALHSWRESGEGPRLVDCREEDEFAINRINGAELIPLSRFAEESREKLLGASDHESLPPVVIYCHHGMRSLQATHFLRQRGYENCWSLAGGIDAWSLEINAEEPRAF